MQLIMDMQSAGLDSAWDKSITILSQIGGIVDHFASVQDALKVNRQARENILATFAIQEQRRPNAEIQFLTKRLRMGNL